jgi:hypothetical protein
MAIPTRKYGNSGLELTILGFGAMRLPGFRTRRYEEHMEGAVRLMRRGIELGINYIDTAQYYDKGYSEIAVGKAIQGVRDRVSISTKIVPLLIPSANDFQRLFDESCERLGTERVDIFYFHGLALEQFEGQVAEMKLLREVERLKSAGRIGHLGFSSHDTPENISQMLDSGAFDGMLVQYNLIDESNAEVIRKAHKNGMGVVLMGPVGGGRLVGAGPDFTRLIPAQLGDAPTLALKFVWSNPGVVCALSGMESMEILEKNVRLAKGFTPLSAAEYEKIDELKDKLEGLQEIYCSGCGYCMPCEQGVNIPGIFNLLICHEIFGAKQYATDLYRMIGILPHLPGRNASECIECGECEEKCPQKVPIVEQLKKAHEILSK